MPLHVLWRLIRFLLVALGAPGRAVARLWTRDIPEMLRIAALLKAFRRMGYALRYEGEDAATLERRLDMLQRMARDPHGVMRAAALCVRGFRRWREAAQWAPPMWAPKALALIALAFAPLHDPLADIAIC